MNAARMGFRIVCGLVFVLALAQVLFGVPAHSAEQSAAPAGGTSEESVAPANADLATKSATLERASAIAELENRTASLEEKSRQLDDQEKRIAEREKELDKKIQEMERMRAAINGDLDAQKKNNEEKVLKMVSVFSNMSPKSAAAVIETLDDWLAVEVLKRMDDKRVAKILNVTEKTRTAKLSEMLTGFYRPDADRKISSQKKSENVTGHESGASPAASPVSTGKQVDKTKKERG